MEGKMERKRLLFDQFLGQEHPEAEQSDEGDAGEDGFHVNNSLPLVSKNYYWGQVLHAIFGYVNSL